MQLHRVLRTAAVIALTLTAGPVTAQAYHWDLGINGGYQGSTNALSSATIVDNNALTVNPLIVGNDGTIITSSSDLHFKSAGIFGATAGYWFTHYIGFRLNGAYSPSGFSQQSIGNLLDHANLWSATGDLMVRFIKPRPKFIGVEWLPYASAGLGAQWVAAGKNVNGVSVDADTFTFTGSQLNGNNGTAIVCVRGTCQGPNSPLFIGVGNTTQFDTATFFIKNTTLFTGLLALGTDIRVSKGWAFRVEAGDRIWEAPIYRAFQRDGFDNTVFVRDRVGKTVNQFYITGGVNVLFGIEPPPAEPVAVQPAPPPPPPPPAPATEAINVCVVDPSVSGGLKTLDAMRNLTTGDTTVVSSGMNVPLSSTLSNVPVASNADWFLAGRPLEIGTTSDKLQYVAVGGSRIISASDLAFLGTVYGLPVYVDRNMLGPIEGFSAGTDLTSVIDARPIIRRAIEDKVPVVYVPLQKTGCTFQPMQIVAKVKKDH